MPIFSIVLRFFGIRTYASLRLIIRFFAISSGLFFAFRFSEFLTKEEWNLATYWYFGVAATSIVEIVFADAWAERSFPFDTERKLFLMEGRLGLDCIGLITTRVRESISRFKGCDKSVVSATVHVLAELSSTSDQRVRQGLLQLTDYVGPEGGRKGRLTLLTQGIIGQCARTGRMACVGFASQEEYSESMVKNFGYTIEEATSHSKKGRSYMAIPLINDSKLIGVLYYFSTEPQVFPRSADIASLEDLGRSIVDLIKVIRLD